MSLSPGRCLGDPQKPGEAAIAPFDPAATRTILRCSVEKWLIDAELKAEQALPRKIR